MRYLPLIGAILGLMVLVVMMAGPGEKRVRVVQSIAMTLAALVLMALIFGLIARDAF